MRRLRAVCGECYRLFLLACDWLKRETGSRPPTEHHKVSSKWHGDLGAANGDLGVRRLLHMSLACGLLELRQLSRPTS